MKKRHRKALALQARFVEAHEHFFADVAQRDRRRMEWDASNRLDDWRRRQQEQEATRQTLVDAIDMAAARQLAPVVDELRRSIEHDAVTPREGWRGAAYGPDA